MVISYDNRKKSYDSMDDSKKQQYNDLLKNKGDDYIGNQYMKQYNNETNNTPQSNNNSSNFNNQNGTNWQNQTNFDTPTVQKTESQNNNQNNQTYNYDPNEKLDTSMFGASDGKVVVKEWTAQQTWKPDYQLDSDARTKEITDNLNAYWQTNREYFQDRNTYNNMFHYNERSDQQKAVLDSYWKKKEDMNVAEKYNTADGIKSWMNDADITPDQLNYIKEYSPEAYKEWQQKQLDDINLRIANLATPADPTDNAELFNTLLTKLGLEPWDPYQIYDNWYDMAERLWVFSDSEKLKSYQNQLDANHSKMESIMSRYAASTWWTVSDALAAARMNKALAPYQQREVDLQNSYTTLLNGRNSNLAIANQSATALAMQAQEDQRIWNQRSQGLGFAMTTASYRSPEQQAQLQLQTAQIQNDMNLLQTSMQNDLNRYNAYATAKMQNQLQQELTDLSVEDEAQLKANLNNALSDYYKNYGDIIQRSQAQAVEDIIAYAKKNWISVAQAMTENFIKPLQNKPEYKQKVASDYGMLAKQSIGTINWRSVIMTTNPNWSISYQFINDDRTAVESTYTVWNTAYVKLYNGETMTAEEYNKQYWGNIKAYNQVDSRAFIADPISTWYEWKTLYDFLNDPKNKAWNTWWQCAAFVNRYLESIWVGKYYGLEDVKTREKRCNSDTPQVWTIAVFDYNHYTDWKNYGHVAIVTKTYADWSFDVIDSNYDTKNPWKITKRHINAGTSSLKWFFDPSKPASVISSGESETFEWGWNTYNLSGYSWWNDLTDTEKDTVVNLLTYQTDPASLPKSWKDNWASNQKVRAAAASIGRDFGYSERKYSLVKNAEKVWDDKSLKWDISRNATSVSILKNLADSYWDLNNWDIQKVNQWINNIKTQFWDAVTLSTAANMAVAAEEIAWALKWWASPSEKDTQNILDLFNGNLSNAQAQDLFRTFAKDLLDKNMTEAQRFRQTTWYKPYSIYTDEVSDRVYNDMGLTDLARYYDYTPVNAYTSWPQDQIYDLWKDDFEDNYGVDYDYAYSLVNG